MAGKYKKKNYKKKSYRKKRDDFAISNSKMTTPLGVKFKTTLRYIDLAKSLDADSGLLDDNVYSCNGLYDPDISGIGIQPYGYDQIQPLYDHYTVIAARMKVTYFNTDTNNLQMVGISIQDTSNLLTDARAVAGQGNCKWVMLGAKGSSRDTVTLTYDINPSRFLGISHPMSSTQTRGSIASNPVEQCYFHVFGGANASLNPGAIVTQVTIEYTAIFTEPKNVGTS